MQLKNYMEEIVPLMIDEVLEEFDMCRCEKCRMDILALALNSLPSKYVVTEKGAVYSKANSFFQQFEVDIISAITKAALIVKEKPRHSKTNADDQN